MKQEDAHFCQLQVNKTLKEMNRKYYFNIKNEVTYQRPSKCWEVGSVGFNSIAFCKDKAFELSTRMLARNMAAYRGRI